MSRIDVLSPSYADSYAPPAASLGRCPDCGKSVSRRQILIEYETSDGRTKAFAECPACARVSPPLRTRRGRGATST